MTTLFQDKIYNIVKKIPKGRVLTYKEIAEKTDKPRVWQAIGNILNRNNNPAISCHRVVRSDGVIGGYNRGPKLKIALLIKEGVMIKNNKIIKIKK